MISDSVCILTLADQLRGRKAQSVLNTCHIKKKELRKRNYEYGDI